MRIRPRHAEGWVRIDFANRQNGGCLRILLTSVPLSMSTADHGIILTSSPVTKGMAPGLTCGIVKLMQVESAFCLQCWSGCSFVSVLVLMLVCSYFDRTHHQVLYLW